MNFQEGTYFVWFTPLEDLANGCSLFSVGVDRVLLPKEFQVLCKINQQSTSQALCLSVHTEYNKDLWKLQNLLLIFPFTKWNKTNTLASLKELAVESSSAASMGDSFLCK